MIYDEKNNPGIAMIRNSLSYYLFIYVFLKYFNLSEFHDNEKILSYLLNKVVDLS